jgi:hypothetical protein
VKIVKYHIALSASRKAMAASHVKTKLTPSSTIGPIKAFQMFTNAPNARVSLRNQVDVQTWTAQLVVTDGAGCVDRIVTANFTI